jgi:flagellar motor switch protein FliM
MVDENNAVAGNSTQDDAIALAVQTIMSAEADKKLQFAMGDVSALHAGQNITQKEIDAMFSIDVGNDEASEAVYGIRAMLDRALMSYERLPMLEVVFDRFVRTLSTSLRNLTSENVDVEIRAISSLRFGDYVNSIPMPALLTIFKVIEWENFGIITADGALIYSLVDILFGGRKVFQPVRFEGRPFTQIEQGVVRQMTEVVLSDLGAAFEPLSPSTFSFERIETNPSFASIARQGDAAILVQLQINMDQRGGVIEILFPYATLEPVRDLLLQVFMGEKFGVDPNWELQLETQLASTSIEIEAVLNEKTALLIDIMKLRVGSTILLDNGPEDDIILKCADSKMFSGKLGKSNGHIAVSVNNVLFEHLKETVTA